MFLILAASRSCVRLYASLIAAIGLQFLMPSDSRAQDMHVIVVDYGTGSNVSDWEHAVREALSGRLVAAHDDAVTSSRASQRLVAAPATEVDAFIRASLDPLAVGRELFFEGDYERASTIFERRLAAIRSSPEVLAFRRDLVPVLMETFLVYVQALDELDEGEASEQVLVELAALFPFAVPNETATPPAVISRFNAARERVLDRAVRVEWRGAAGCELFGNGSPTRVQPGGTIRLAEASPVFLVLHCQRRAGNVVRTYGSADRFRWDAAFDDAYVAGSEPLTLRPRTHVDPELLPRLLETSSDVLGGTVLSVARVPLGVGQPSGVELALRRGGEFRAIRMSKEAAEDPDTFGEAIDYLLGSLDVAPSPSIVWATDPAWVPQGEWNGDSAAVPSARGNRAATGFGWSSLALGVAGAGVASYFFVKQRDVQQEIDACDFSTCLGTPEIADLRAQVESNRRGGIIASSIAGSLAVAGILALSVRAGRVRDTRRSITVESASIELRPRGLLVGARLQF